MAINVKVSEDKKEDGSDMLFQFHWRDKKPPYKTEFVSQFGVPDDQYKSGNAKPIIQAELDRAIEKHPLPDGKMWMLCREGSEHFLMTYK